LRVDRKRRADHDCIGAGDCGDRADDDHAAPAEERRWLQLHPIAERARGFHVAGAHRRSARLPVYHGAVAYKSQPAPSLERKFQELEAALVRETRVSGALREVGLALGTTLDLDQVLELILAKI